MATGEITKTDTPAPNFHKHSGEKNPYVWFGYGTLTIWNHNQWNSSSINEPLHNKHDTQNSKINKNKF